MAGFQAEQSTVKTTDNEFLISSVLRNSAVQHVQSGLSTAEQPSFRQHVSTLVTNPDLMARDDAKRGLTTIMSRSNIGKPEATTALDFVDTYGAARTHAIKNGNMDHVKQLDDGVASGKYKSANDVLKQMENWGYHDFVQQQQNANAQNEALVSIVFAIILQGISLLIQQRLQQMQEAKDDEPVRNKYKKDLDDKLGEIGVTSVEAKQKIAEKATDALSDGNLNDAVLVKIITQVQASQGEATTLRLQPTAFSEIDRLAKANPEYSAIVASATVEARRQFNATFNPEQYFSDKDKLEAAITKLKQVNA